VTVLIREQGLVDLLVPGERRRAARVSAIGHGHVLLTLFGLPIETTLTGRPTDARTSDDPEVDPLLGAGRIVRVQGDGEYAVEFGPWPEGELRRLRLLLDTGRVQA